MRYALVKQEKVENIIIADQAFIDAHMASKYDHCVLLTEGQRVNIGDGYVNGEFIEQTPPE